MSNTNLPEIPKSGKEALGIIGGSAAAGSMIGTVVFPGPGSAIGASAGGVLGSIIVLWRSLDALGKNK